MFGMTTNELKRYMVQDVFNMGTVGAVYWHIASQASLRECCRKAFGSYVGDYEDDGFMQQGERAAAAISRLLDGYTLREQQIILDQLMFCIERFWPNGEKKKWKLFNGTKHNYERYPQTDRANVCVKDVAVYHLGSLNGVFPLTKEYVNRRMAGFVGDDAAPPTKPTARKKPLNKNKKRE